MLIKVQMEGEMTETKDTKTRIITQPSEEDLKPTEREKQLLQDIFDWYERSAKTDWILGEPI